MAIAAIYLYTSSRVVEQCIHNKHLYQKIWLDFDFKQQANADSNCIYELGKKNTSARIRWMKKMNRIKMVGTYKVSEISIRNLKKKTNQKNII